MHSDRLREAGSGLGLAALLISLALAGCTASPTARSVVTELRAVKDDRPIEFWYQLASRSIATNDDAFHALLLCLDGADSCDSYDARVALLQSRGMLPRDFNQGAEQAVERGTVACVLVKGMNLRVGLTLRVFGNSPRYAVRELEARNLLPPSSPQQILTGTELVGIIARVETFTDGDPANYPASVLYPGAPETELQSAIEMQTADVLEPANAPVLLSTTANFSLQAQAPGAASQPLKLPEGALQIVVSAVRGSAEFRPTSNDEWKPVTVGQSLPEGAQLRTSYKGAVQLQIVPDQVVTLDSLGVLTIDRATLSGGKFTTRLSMPQGSTRIMIEGANREFDATVSSPNSTLGIRGTRVSLVDRRPFPPEAVSLTGRAEFQNVRRQLVSLGKRGQGKTKIAGANSSPAEFALSQSVVDPASSTFRSESEQPLISSLLSSGAVLEFDRELGIPIVRGGTPPGIAAPASELVPLLPGQLTFVLRWDTPGVNLNIAVLPPSTTANANGELLFAAPGLVQTASGGRLPFDHRGGDKGGIEVAYWNGKSYPTGTYAVLGTNQSTTPALARIDAFVDSKLVEPDPLLGLPAEQIAFPAGESDAILFFNIGADASSTAAAQTASVSTKRGKPTVKASKPPIVTRKAMVDGSPRKARRLPK